MDIGIISKQLGHRSIATTARYLDHIAPQQVIETIQQRAWQGLTGKQQVSCGRQRVSDGKRRASAPLVAASRAAASILELLPTPRQGL